MMLFKRIMGNWFDPKAVEVFSYLIGYFTMYAMLYICLQWLSEHYKNREMPHV
jgi:hypothetical protein